MEVEKSHEHNTILISWNFLKSKLIIPAHEFNEDVHVPVVRGVKLDGLSLSRNGGPLSQQVWHENDSSLIKDYNIYFHTLA